MEYSTQTIVQHVEIVDESRLKRCQCSSSSTVCIKMFHVLNRLRNAHCIWNECLSGCECKWALAPLITYNYYLLLFATLLPGDNADSDPHPIERWPIVIFYKIEKRALFAILINYCRCLDNELHRMVVVLPNFSTLCKISMRVMRFVITDQFFRHLSDIFYVIWIVQASHSDLFIPFLAEFINNDD